MKRVVLFGEGEFARLAQFYLTEDSPHEVAAFTVDGAHVTAATVQGLPVVPFEEILTLYPPDDFSMFIAVGYARMNKLRQSTVHAAKELGYNLVTYLSSTATTWPGTSIGDNCYIMEQTVIQPFVTIGNNVVVWSGCHINHESNIQDHCFLSSASSSPASPRSSPNCSLGLHATIRNGITVARECVIGADSLIMKDTRPREVYSGHRALLLRIPSDRLPTSALRGQVKPGDS